MSRTERLLVVTIAALAGILTFGLSGTAMAFHEGGVAHCDGCHSMHDSPENPVLGTPNTLLLKGSDPSSTCLNCHQGAGSLTSYHIFSGNATAWSPGGDFFWLTQSYTNVIRGTPVTSDPDNMGHNIIAADFGLTVDGTNSVSPGGAYPASNLGCSSCHDPHGQVNGGTANGMDPISVSGSYGDVPVAGTIAGNYRLLGDSFYKPYLPATAPIAVLPFATRFGETDASHPAYGQGMSEWCAGCHGDYTGDNTKHPAANSEALGSDKADTYNAYVATGDFTGGKTLNLRINRGVIQYIPFLVGDFVDPANPTQDEVFVVLAREATGCTVTKEAGNTIKLWTDTFGTDAYIRVLGGDANTELGFPTAEVQGVGNVGDKTAVTSTEVVALLQALGNHGTTFHAEVSAGKVRVYTEAEGAAVYLGFDAPSLMAAKMGWTVGAGGDVYGTDASGNLALKLKGASEGTPLAGIQVTIQDNEEDSTRFDIIVPVQSGTHYRIEAEERYEDLTVDDADPRYVESVINGVSRWISVEDQDSPSTAPDDEPLAGTYTLAGGNDGQVGLVGADYLGDLASGLGVHAFDNLTVLGDDVMDVMTPYLTDRDTMYQIAAYTEGRRDMVYHMTHPTPASSDDAIAFRDATGAYAAGTKFNTSYASLVTGTGRVIDPRTSADVWLDALAGFAAVLSYNDSGHGKSFSGVGPQYAPAGTKRGLAKAYLAINPQYGAPGWKTTDEALEEAHIIRLSDYGEGPVIWDQRTLKIADSVFQDLNVRRGSIYIEQKTMRAIRSVTWEPLDPIMFREAYEKARFEWEIFKNNRGCTDYRIYCDQDIGSIDEVVVQDLIDQGIFKMLIYYKHTRAARTLLLTFTATSTSVNFEELEV